MRTVLTALLFSSEYQKWRYRCAFVLYFLIVAIGAIPGARSEIGHFATGIVLHSMAYAAITFLLFSGMSGPLPPRAVKSVLTVMAMGALDEFIQSFIPYRRGAVSDWLVDSNAAIIMSLLLWVFWPQSERAPRQ